VFGKVHRVLSCVGSELKTPMHGSAWHHPGFWALGLLQGRLGFAGDIRLGLVASTGVRVIQQQLRKDQGMAG